MRLLVDTTVALEGDSALGALVLGEDLELNNFDEFFEEGEFWTTGFEMLTFELLMNPLEEKHWIDPPIEMLIETLIIDPPFEILIELPEEYWTDPLETLIIDTPDEEMPIAW